MTVTTRHDVAGRRVDAGSAPTGDFTYSVVAVDVRGPASDRRGERRVRTRLREALVAERRGRTLVDCRIRDLTKRGARLHLDRDRPLPRAFLLTEANSRRSFWATLVWQTGRDAGVRLVPIE